VNPYLAAIECGPWERRGNRYEAPWDSRAAKSAYPAAARLERHYRRRRYSYAIPNAQAIAALCDLSPLIEVGAGTGYWASVVQERGGDILPFDDGSWYCRPRFWPRWTTVFQGGASVVARYPGRTLFLCWPPSDDSMATDSLRLYTGRTFIYVGEGGGGCTGDDEFHAMLERDWTLAREIMIPQWHGINDIMAVYERNGAA